MARAKGSEKTAGSGRVKGTPNKATADIKALLRVHGEMFVEELVKLCTHTDPNIRHKALKLAFDRGYGQAVQHIEAEINVYEDLSFDEREAMLSTVRALIADIEADREGPEPTHH